MTREQNHKLRWGAAAIAEYIGRSERQAQFLIQKGVIPVKRLGARTIVANTDDLDRLFGLDKSDSDSPRADVPADNEPQRVMRVRG